MRAAKGYVNKYVILTAIFVMAGLAFCATEVKGAVKGNGKSDNPYIVNSGSDLKDAVSKASANGWTYIALESNVTLKESLKISKGKLSIYAKGGDRSINKSVDLSAAVNDADTPSKMIVVKSGATLKIGEKGDALAIDGRKDKIQGIENTDVLCVELGGTLTLDQKSVVRNCRNMRWNDESAPIRVYGYLNVWGEIKNCEGLNGGAIKCIGGTVNIDKKAHIHNCHSGTEGGAIYVRNNGTLYMEPGTVVENNVAEEEGGGIFITYNSEARIFGGIIRNNSAGKSAGGVFSGYGATLILGREKTAPLITGNKSNLIGGGIRCNGGANLAGGKTIINNCEIYNNYAKDSGGGMSIGGATEHTSSIVDIQNLNIHDNESYYGGGMYVENGAVSSGSDSIVIKNSGIYENSGVKGGGIYTKGKVTSDLSSISRNNASESSGGVHVYSTGLFRMFNGSLSGNTSKIAAGIYQGGLLEIGEIGNIDTNNEVYLPSGHHIDVVKKMEQGSGYLALINSANKTPGTIVVDVTYKDGTCDGELYHRGDAMSEKRGESVTKKFRMKDGLLLRPGTNYVGLKSKRYIVISKKYKIEYNENTEDEVLNNPVDEIGYHNEESMLNNVDLIREGFVFNKTKSWNTSSLGTGTVYSLGSIVVVKSDMTLYAIWDEIPIAKLFMTTRDRYYFVGQDIILTKDEVTKKTIVNNDMNTDVTYPIFVKMIKSRTGRNIASSDDVKVENYISTSESGVYVLELEASSYRGDVKVSGIMKVYVLENDSERSDVRFVSKDFIDTIAPWSVWKEKYYSELEASLGKDDDDCIYTVELSKEDLEQISQDVKNNSHKVTKTVVKKVVSRVKS